MHFGSPVDLTIYKLLTDWGSIIGGVFTLLAGWLAYSAAGKAARVQVDAATRRDRLEAQGIIIGIYPELHELQAAQERADRALKNGTSPETVEDLASFARAIRIALPPFMARNIDKLFLIANSATVLFEMISAVDQYNAIVKTISKNGDDFDFTRLQEKLLAIRIVVGVAIKEVSMRREKLPLPTAAEIGL